MMSIATCIAVTAGLAALCEQSTRLMQERSKLSDRPMPVRVFSGGPSSEFDLPTFDPGKLVKTFNSIANDMQVPFDDVTYVIDRTLAVPYLRYRITVSSKAGYSELRKFIAVLSSEMPNLSLDSIRCTRANAAAPTLDCELAFSAFYAKEGTRG